MTDKKQQFLKESFWYAPKRPPLFLIPLSKLYGALMAWRTRLYGSLFKIKKAAKPVIAIGNLTVGGTGKTPLCLYLAQALSAQNLKVAILSRGYGRKGKKPLVLSTGQGPQNSWQEAGDEPFLMAQQSAAFVLVDADRARAAQVATDVLGADVLILDDGFQYLALETACKILLVPAQNPFGNGYVLPAGPLREKIAAQQKADIIMETGSLEPGPIVRSLAADRPCFAAEHRPKKFRRLADNHLYDLSELENQGVLAFCALGRPLSFYQSLEHLKLKVLATETFRDHSGYDENKIKALEEKFTRLKKEAGASFLVTTAKDAVKISPLCPLAQYIFILDIELKIDRAEEFLKEVMRHAQL